MTVAVLAVAPVVLLTLFVGVRGVAAMRTTSDFLVASRQVSPLLNSAAVSGEYLSAASFLGIAGMMVKDGPGALWYPVGFTAGYVAMLVLVAAPMRRSGALTVPDFAEARLASTVLRKLTAVVVLLIAVLYLVPQFRTAGLVLSAVSATPYWVGVVVAGGVISVTLALGGMRAATYVQAVQFCLKLLLFTVPAVWLTVHAGAEVRQQALQPVEFERFEERTRVEFRIGVTFRITEPTRIHRPGGGARVLHPGTHQVRAGRTLVFPAGEPVPHVGSGGRPGGERWQRPLLDVADAGHPLFGTWAVLIATMFGTMGLPHVVVRFHTTPDGAAARRTAALTVGLLSVFYLFPGVYGALGRVLLPRLYLSGGTDTVVVALPARVDTGWAGTLFTVLLTGGAFAAFMATSLGLLLVLAGAVSHDLAPGGLGRLRGTALLAAAVVILLALFAAPLETNILVTWAFTLAAATFCPLLVLGIWWWRLTAAGAVSGVLLGLLGSSAGIVVTLFGPELSGWWAILLAQPAPWVVPLAFGTMVLVSLRSGFSPRARSAMLRLHLDQRTTPDSGR
ncbi:Sodium:solute symporter family protein [Actinopolyspora mzabensis]|uniref:Sodium:solute symporter family protein n=1 Tax=Actinopolyspora mzabensis TaxID=995066 RepID=A0A1G8XSZ3_ACTMZ|nr:cation acetate symporter [Actinopolyspora mzabensis]SDJ93643.1 Sodium:solute symporter family protein [Actinopolyspora mzabensis]